MDSNPSVPHVISVCGTRRRIAWITPDYPPDRGGVSDHSSVMVGILRAAGHHVLICSKPHERGFSCLNSELAAYGPELVVVAYTPLGYAPRTFGLSPAFMLWSVQLRKRFGCRAILLAHETSLSVAYLWQRREYKLAALGVTQVAQFATLVKGFNAVIFSNMGAQREWARRLPRLMKQFHVIRICSNIAHEATSDAAAELRAAGYSVPSPTILFFGTGHEAVLFDYLDAAFRALIEIEPDARLVIVGMTLDKLREIHPSLANLGHRVQALGYVPAREVSLWLQVARLVLAPIVDGINARKGTVMAALQHGRAVVTTRGANTLDDIAWDDICLLAPLDRESFAAKAVAALRDPELCASIGRAARAEYETHASAQVTALRILECASEIL